MAIAAASICFIACHGGPADHFCTFAQELKKNGRQVEIYASALTFQKFWEKGLNPISMQDLNAKEVAEKCKNCSVVITDVGDLFDEQVQKALAECAPGVTRYAYYDNPEDFVTVEYSATATKVMAAANRVLFANVHLEKVPVLDGDKVPVDLPEEKRVGLGYYPVENAQKIGRDRLEQKGEIRKEFFSKWEIEDQGQKILVYTGGCNDVYFAEAFPKFLEVISDSAGHKDFSKYLIVLQQHPRAKVDNRDLEILQKWNTDRGAGISFVVSDSATNEVMKMADAMIYYQTSMSPQFALAGIATIQVGHDDFKDCLVKSKLCSAVKNAGEFLAALDRLDGSDEVSSEVVEKGIGYLPDWKERLLVIFK
ncbi:MAG: hypothetical protein COT85_01525 [Chlamydiae bacterium CG10_big_fil_rev_8_21_14_0_10_42_34]|nr:MAG: hypothetical protein COT85_01525 [Chlamydiae bacterium CG10_big_fil_rev_8_21_14_0_10_42_34]